MGDKGQGHSGRGKGGHRLLQVGPSPHPATQKKFWRQGTIPKFGSWRGGGRDGGGGRGHEGRSPSVRAGGGGGHQPPPNYLRDSLRVKLARAAPGGAAGGGRAGGRWLRAGVTMTICHTGGKSRHRLSSERRGALASGCGGGDRGDTLGTLRPTPKNRPKNPWSPRCRPVPNPSGDREVRDCVTSSQRDTGVRDCPLSPKKGTQGCPGPPPTHR